MRLAKHTQRAILVSILVVLITFILFGFSQEEWVDIAGRKADDIRWRLSMTFAYSCLVLLTYTMSIGTLNLIQKKPNPKHNPSRRAYGIISACLGLAHLVIASSIHTTNWALAHQFLWKTDLGWLPYIPRYDQHGIANNLGLLQASLFIILIILSTKWAMKHFKIPLWKNLQRSVYLIFTSIIIHALLYQIIEERSLIIRAVFFAIIATVIFIQLFGVLLHIRSLNVKQNKL